MRVKGKDAERKGGRTSGKEGEKGPVGEEISRPVDKPRSVVTHFAPLLQHPSFLSSHSHHSLPPSPSCLHVSSCSGGGCSTAAASDLQIAPVSFVGDYL